MTVSPQRNSQYIQIFKLAFNIYAYYREIPIRSHPKLYQV